MYKKKLICVLACSGLLLAGCSTKEIQSRGNLDYLQASTANPLEVPPDLVKRANTGQDHSANVLSEYRNKTQKGSSLNVLVKHSDVTIESAGNHRWIVAKLPADFVWTKAMQLFQELGLTIEYSNPEAGLAETAWAENRADVPDSFLRRLLKRTMDQLFSSPTRDKFKLRLERRDQDTILVHVTHYGMKDQASGRDDEFHTWVDRPRDSELEAEFLSRLVVKLGGREARTSIEHGSVVVGQVGNTLTINRPFNSVWVQVGNVLDDGAEYRIEEQHSDSNSYKVLRAKKAKRGLAFWRKKVAYDSFVVRVNEIGKNQTEITITPDGDNKYQQALIDKLKTNIL